jgi:ketosteroid isomerase-like protein
MEGGWDAQQVIVSVARCSDRTDIAGLAAHFTDDAVLEAGGRTVEGRDAIFEFFGGPNAAPTETERTKHVVTNTLVDAEGDSLVTTSYWHVLRSWGIANWGRYVDRLVQRDGRWQIAHRTVLVDGNLPRPAPAEPKVEGGGG